MTLICRFSPFDTWFFRESRPHGSIGSSELASVFPPPVRTLLGAVRTVIGDAWHACNGTNWRSFEKLELPELQALIGTSDSLGHLCCNGPWLVKNGQRLYPAPATLMVKDEVYFSLGLGDPVHCDLGKLRLPAFPTKVKGLDNLAGAKPLGQCWLTEAGWRAILEGQAVEKTQILHTKDLFDKEPRLGIGRDNHRSAVKEGLLYQTCHLRLKEGVAVELHIEGLPDSLLSDLAIAPSQVIRLGGEGRPASLSLTTVKNASALPPIKSPLKSGPLVLYLLTPMLCTEGQPAGIPKGFKPVCREGIDAWEGSIAGVNLRIWAVACGRLQREGGWDMAKHQSRPVQSLLPAGSALFVEALDAEGKPSTPASLLPLHNQIISPDAALGRGQLVLGRLPNLTTSGK